MWSFVHVLISSSYKDPAILDQGPPIWPHFTLTTSLKAISPNTVTFWSSGGLGLQHMNLGGHNSTHNNILRNESSGTYNSESRWQGGDLSGGVIDGLLEEVRSELCLSLGSPKGIAWNKGVCAGSFFGRWSQRARDSDRRSETGEIANTRTRCWVGQCYRQLGLLKSTSDVPTQEMKWVHLYPPLLSPSARDIHTDVKSPVLLHWYMGSSGSLSPQCQKSPGTGSERHAEWAKVRPVRLHLGKVG